VTANRFCGTTIGTETVVTGVNAALAATRIDGVREGMGRHEQARAYTLDYPGNNDAAIGADLAGAAAAGAFGLQRAGTERLYDIEHNLHWNGRQQRLLRPGGGGHF
jgi:hypothetical protein